MFYTYLIGLEEKQEGERIMQFMMSIKIESEHRETNLKKESNLHFVPTVGMEFHYGVDFVTVKSVSYSELTDTFILFFENLEIEDSLLDETVVDFKEDGWDLEDLWKKK
jgi:hypothetical protein